jgi:hypothetical protein
LSKIGKFFGSAKNGVTHQFDSTKDEIGRIADGLRVGVKRMEDEAKWLQKARDANEQHLLEYQELHADLMIAIEEEKEKLALIPQTDVQAVADQRTRVERFERHANKIFKQIHQNLQHEPYPALDWKDREFAYQCLDQFSKCRLLAPNELPSGTFHLDEVGLRQLLEDSDSLE